MQIGELAKRTGVSVRVLRHYEKQHLMTSQRRQNGYREYHEETVEVVRVVRMLLQCGFSTRQIQEIPFCVGGKIDGSPAACAASIAMHHTKLSELDHLITLLTERRENLGNRIATLTAHQSTLPLAPDEAMRDGTSQRSKKIKRRKVVHVEKGLDDHGNIKRTWRTNGAGGIGLR
jgi:MerR family copper efflux transcriptional regulator